MSPETVKFFGLAVIVAYPFYLLRQRKEKKALQSSLFIEWSDCLFARTMWDTEKRLNGEDHAYKIIPPERLAKTVYPMVLENLGFEPDMKNELKGVPLKKLRFLSALQTVSLNDDDSVKEAFKAYPKHRAYFENVREIKKCYVHDMNARKNMYDAKDEKREQAKATRIDVSQQLENRNDLLNWLVQHGPDPDFWHVILCNTDPDGREDVYHWIVSQPECDAGTAAQIFHHSNAYEALEYRASELPLYQKKYETAKIAADRWERGDFLTHKFFPNDIYSSTTREDFKRIENEAIKKFGVPAFKISDGLFDDNPREEPKTNLFISDFE